MSKPEVTAFHDAATGSVSYVVRDPVSAICAVIDPVAAFDLPAGRLSFEPADRLISFMSDQGLTLEWIIETHVHADHLTAAAYIRDRLGGRIAIGGQVAEVQSHFGEVFEDSAEFRRDGSQFDHLFADDETYAIGGLAGRAWSTPGHTPACMTHLIGDCAFVGDTLFMPDGGTARADFPGGCAHTLFRSIRRILSLPDETRIFTGHDYAPNGRAVAWQSSVAEQRAGNIHVHDGVTEDDYVTLRQTRDRTLAVPNLIIPALQVNMRAGHLPQGGLKLPVNRF